MPLRARAPVVAVLAALVAMLPACGRPSAAGDMPDLHGARVVVVGDWSGDEQRHFVQVLARFARSTGAIVRYVAARDGVPTTLDARLAAGDPPDVALLPQPGLLRRYAGAGRLVPLAASTVRLVRDEYDPTWLRLATDRGRMYGVWFKAANKSLLWYDVGSFERLGLAPPATLDDLDRTVAALRDAHIVPFALGEQDRWTLTDWFENLYLQLAGPERYDRLAAHRLAWTDASVVAVLRRMARLLAPRNLLAGSPRTGFDVSVQQAFGPPARAAMLMEGDFVAGALPPAVQATLGVDVDAVPFPAADPTVPAVVGGGDVAVQLRRSAAAAALMRYLATPAAAAVWARAGGFVSANQELDLSVYRDPLQRSFARTLVEADGGFRFDLSDLQPDAFGSTASAGLQAGLAELLRTGDAVTVAAQLERAAVAAYGGRP